MVKNVLQAAIATLPTGSSGEVFNFLLERGIEGRRKEPCGCPIAVYLAGELGHVTMVSATTASTGDLLERLPDAVQVFITHFDTGGFPELDAVEKIRQAR